MHNCVMNDLGDHITSNLIKLLGNIQIIIEKTIDHSKKKVTDTKLLSTHKDTVSRCEQGPSS